MTRTISLSESTADLGMLPVFSTTPLLITGAVPAAPAMSQWVLELWKRQNDAREPGATPLASSAGFVAGGAVTFVLTAAQMNLVLSDEVNSNNYWLAIGGLDSNGFPYLLRSGNLEVIPSGLSLTPTTTIAFSVVNEVVSFAYNGAIYRFDAVTDTPPGPIDGEVTVIDGMIVVTVDGVSYSVPAVS